MLALIDGDIVTFRAAFSAEEEPVNIACSRASTMLDMILLATKADEYKVFLSGDGNFRYKVFPEYKANRLKSKRPKWEKEVRSYLEIEWNAELSQGCEADDMMGVSANENTVICTIDKDLDQIPGLHYNFVKDWLYDVSPEKARYNFYYQLLVGDTADGIKGVPGIGPKKAQAILGQCETERELFEACREAYGNDDELAMNAKCLHVWRKIGDIWKWPTFERMDKST